MTLDTQDDIQPQVDLPPVAAGTAGHDDIVASALAEGELDARLGELAKGDEELTADQLREALGDVAEGLTNEELLDEWKKAQEAEAQTDETKTSDEEQSTTPTPEPIKLEGFKLYDAEGKEIADLTKVSAADLLTGKVQIGYNALSKEQRKNLRDLTRVASLGHYNEKVLLDTRSERQQAMQRAQAAEAKIAEFSNIQRTWDAALTALVNGNPEPIQRLALAYQQALAQGGIAAAPHSADNSAQESQWNAAGQQFFNETIIPRARELAQQYGSDAIEIAQYMLYLCDQEGDFLTPEKIQAILTYEMPAILESHGFAAKSTGTAGRQDDPRDAKIGALEKQVAELMAGKKNESTQRLREKGKKAPPPGGGATPGAITVPEMKTREDMKRFLHGEE